MGQHEDVLDLERENHARVAELAGVIERVREGKKIRLR